MRRALVRVAAGLLVVSSLPLTGAWAPETRVRMADEALRLMPTSLRIAMESHRKSLRKGVLEPLVDEDTPSHRPPWSEGTLDSAIEAEAQRLAEMLAQPRPSFSQVTEQFGRLAHFVLDAGFPPGVSEHGDGRYAHFSAFCESRREKFALVFYGHEQEAEKWA